MGLVLYGCMTNGVKSFATGLSRPAAFGCVALPPACHPVLPSAKVGLRGVTSTRLARGVSLGALSCAYQDEPYKQTGRTGRTGQDRTGRDVTDGRTRGLEILKSIKLT